MFPLTPHPLSPIWFPQSAKSPIVLSPTVLSRARLGKPSSNAARATRLATSPNTHHALLMNNRKGFLQSCKFILPWQFLLVKMFGGVEYCARVGFTFPRDIDCQHTYKSDWWEHNAKLLHNANPVDCVRERREIKEEKVKKEGAISRRKEDGEEKVSLLEARGVLSMVELGYFADQINGSCSPPTPFPGLKRLN